jgi:predicted RNA polymerase sigma factor
MSAEEIAAMHAHMGAIHQDLVDSGELVDARGLTAPVHARRVRLAGGVPVVTDGPYAETQEVLAGFTGLDRLDALATDPRTGTDHRLPAVRGHLLELLGDRAAARAAYQQAAGRTASLPQRRYLRDRADRLAAG